MPRNSEGHVAIPPVLSGSQILSSSGTASELWVFLK